MQNILTFLLTSVLSVRADVFDESIRAGAEIGLSEVVKESGDVSQGTKQICKKNGHSVVCAGKTFFAQPENSGGEGTMVFNLLMSVGCVSLAALAAGLTMGLLSLEAQKMRELLATSPEDCDTDQERNELEEEQACAKKVLPLVSNHHLLLVTLLLMNASANEALPLFLDKLVPSWLAVLLSVTLVLFFGEIIPSAIFTGPSQLTIASNFVPLVKFFQFALIWIAWPIAKALDTFLGEDNEGPYSRAELKALIKMASAHDGQHSHQGQNHYTREEMLIMHGALELFKKTAQDSMVPLDRVKMVSVTDVLTLERIAELSAGHSRILVYDGWPHNVRGILLLKHLLVLSSKSERKVGSLGLRTPLLVPLDYPLLDLLNDFQVGKSHMALVCDNPKAVKRAWRSGRQIPISVKMAGIITLEDVIEDLIQCEIEDEADSSVKTNLAKVAFQVKRTAQIREVARAVKETPAIRKSTTTNIKRMPSRALRLEMAESP